MSWARLRGLKEDRISFNRKPLILRVIPRRHVYLRFRGTAIAIGKIAMRDETDLMTNAESQPALGSDWVDAHADYLFNFAIGQVRDANIAEDLVQDTFLAAVKAQNSFGGKSTARTWLVGILRHKIYDHLRKTCRERAVRHDPTPMNDGESWEESALWLHEVAAETQLPSRRIELDEFRTNLEEALGKLPPRIAQVFQLYQIEERPNREVCAQLHISESNLWVMLHRARKQLREHLDGWWSAEPAQKAPDNRLNF
jgi:RNA polymerase sigma-70 factor, ECF subfamily